jgi:hypothetical protein
MADIASAMLFFESGTNAGGNATDATISESDAAFTAPSPTPERSCAARPQARPGRLG